MSDKQKSKTEPRSLGIPWPLWFIGGVAAAFLGVGLYYVREVGLAANFDSLGAQKYNAYGPLGDFFGGFLNPIFSFLALMALIYTLWQQNRIIQQQEKAIALQIEELEATREELKLTREEAEKTSDALEGQQNSLEIQKFENQLFSMINVFNDIIGRSRSFTTTIGQNLAGGRQFYGDFTTHLLLAIRVADEMRSGGGFLANDQKPTADQKEIERVYKHLFNWTRQNLSPYFRYLYRIFKYIDEKCPGDEKDAINYAKVVRAQLSDDEIVMIMYSCFSDKGRNMVRYVNKFEILDNLDQTMLAHESHLELFLQLEKDGTP